jgi:hypothetical protein
VLIADRRIGEILKRRVGAIHHHFGNAAQHAPGHVLRRGAILRQNHIEHAFRFRIHLTRNVEAREIETLRQPFAGRHRGHRRHELGLAFAEDRLAVEAPNLRVEHHRPQCGAVQYALQRARQCQAAGAANHDLLGGQFHMQVVRQRRDDHTVG